MRPDNSGSPWTLCADGSGYSPRPATAWHAWGHKVVYVPGRVVHGMAGVFRGEGKTDAKDARVIADTARMRGNWQNCPCLANWWSS